jgi:hypothetical protein
MIAKRLLLCVGLPLFLTAHSASSHRALAQTPDVLIVKQALAAELRSAQDTQHPMRYRLHKASPRLSTTKDIFETKDGAVARLLAINGKPLSASEEEKEQARLNALLLEPNRQRHRKQSEEEDLGRVTKVLRALPEAFVYHYVESGVGPTGAVEKFSFEPNPNFDPPDLETQALTAMAGEIWIDRAQLRVARLEAHLERDVDFGWGILGRLYKDGWIVIEQNDVGNNQWRIVRFQMVMSGRIIVKTKSFDTTEEESLFTPVPLGMGYSQAIQMLKSSSAPVEEAGR